MLTQANKLFFFPQESVTDNWLFFKSYSSDNRTTFEFKMFSSSCSLMLYAEVLNDDGQHAAVHHIEKEPNLLNRVKLSWSTEVKLRQCQSISSNSWTWRLCFRILTRICQMVIKMWMFRLQWINLHVEFSHRISTVCLLNNHTVKIYDVHCSIVLWSTRHLCFRSCCQLHNFYPIIFVPLNT